MKSMYTTVGHVISTEKCMTSSIVSFLSKVKNLIKEKLEVEVCCSMLEMIYLKANGRKGGI